MKRIIIFVALAAVVGGIIFYACKKDLLTNNEGSVKSHKSSEYYDRALLERFMGEPLVKEFREYINSLEIEKVHGI
ncbi:MAG: hypothetical protein LBI60_04275, partial [Bacteroidales bacterium]|nr:hypothetical protein [Bacteroidales bacterium]